MLPRRPFLFVSAAAEKTPEGAVGLLTALSQDYGEDPATYAQGLLVLREDFRDPVLRARGAAWAKALTAALTECLAATPDAETSARLMLSQWQGSLLWWGFTSEGRVADYVERELSLFLKTLLHRS